MKEWGVDSSVFQDWVKLRALVYAVMKFWFPHNADYVWSSRKTHSFCSLPYNRSKVSTPQSAIQCFFKFPLKNYQFLKKDPVSWNQVCHFYSVNKNCDRYVPYESHNEESLLPSTALTGQSLLCVWTPFSVKKELSF